MISKHLQVYAATSKMTKKVFALENDRFVFENLNLNFLIVQHFWREAAYCVEQGNEMR